MGLTAEPNIYISLLIRILVLVLTLEPKPWRIDRYLVVMEGNQSMVMNHQSCLRKKNVVSPIGNAISIIHDSGSIMEQPVSRVRNGLISILILHDFFSTRLEFIFASSTYDAELILNYNRLFILLTIFKKAKVIICHQAFSVQHKSS